MSRHHIALLLGTALISTGAPAQQLVSSDRAALIEAADRAASEAERAAVSARAAANAARAIAGLPPIAPLQPPQNAAAPTVSAGPISAIAAPESPDSSRLGTAAVAASVANGPNESPLKSTAAPDIQLLASSEDKIASLALTIDVGGRAPPGRLSTQQFSLTASGKLNDSTGEAQIIGLDGFNAGNQIKLVFTGYEGALNLTGVVPGQVEEAERRCRALPGSTPAACVAEDFPTGASMFVAKYYPDGLKPLLKQVIPGPIWLYGAGFTGTQGSFEYLDRTTFSMKKEDHFGLGGTVFGGALFNYGQSAIIGSYEYRRSFSESDPVTLCQPVSGTIQTECVTAADGPPTRKRRSLLGLEFRHAFPAPIGSYSSFAIAPRFVIDTRNGDYSLGVPLYLAGDGTGKLRGGVKGVYTSKKDKDGKRDGDFALGVFVGVPFSVFPASPK